MKKNMHPQPGNRFYRFTTFSLFLFFMSATVPLHATPVPKIPTGDDSLKVSVRGDLDARYLKPGEGANALDALLNNALLENYKFYFDAGVEACRHSPCTGGAQNMVVTDNNTKYADNATVPTTSWADCPAGYVNNGTQCWAAPYGRGVGRMPDKGPCAAGQRDDGTSCWEDLKCNTVDNGYYNYTWGCGTLIAKCWDGRTGCYNDCYRTWIVKLETKCTGCGCIKKTLFERQTCRNDEDKFDALCYPKCKPGYHNTLCCTCTADNAFIDFKDHAYCGLNGTTTPDPTKTLVFGWCFKCPEGKKFWGGLCLDACPNGGTRKSWITCEYTTKMIGNTHLYVVSQALELLSKSTDPIAQKAAARMMRDCPEGYTRQGDNCVSTDAYNNTSPSTVADCPPGYTNMGLDCQKGANIFDRKPMSSMTCPAGKFKVGVRCYVNCREGYHPDATGITSVWCRKNVSPVPVNACRTQWENGLFDMDDKDHADGPNKNMGSHFYNASGKDVYGNPTPIKTYLAADAWGNVGQPAINWSIDSYNKLKNKVDGAGSFFQQAAQAILGLLPGGSLGSDSKQFFLSQLGTIVNDVNSAASNQANSMNTASQNFSATQERNGLNYSNNALAEIKDLNIAGSSTNSNGCYALGKALHYLTDMGNPHHTTGFDAVSGWPIGLHPYFECYMPQVQENYSVAKLGMTWDGQWGDKNPPDVFLEASRRSAALAPDLQKTLVPGLIPGAFYNPVNYNSWSYFKISGDYLGGLGYVGYNFIGDPKVNEQIGKILQQAYQSTASYIYSVFKTKQ